MSHEGPLDEVLPSHTPHYQTCPTSGFLRKSDDDFNYFEYTNIYFSLEPQKTHLEMIMQDLDA